MKLKQNPRIKLELTYTDLLLELSGWLAIVALWGMAIVYFKKLPGNIPVHSDLGVQADSVGGSWAVFVLPLIASVLFIVLTVLNRFPHIFNYPVSINSDNAAKQYLYATRLIRVLKLTLVLTFGSITYSLASFSLTKENGKGIWLIPFILAVNFLPLIVYLAKSFKSR